MSEPNTFISRLHDELVQAPPLAIRDSLAREAWRVTADLTVNGRRVMFPDDTYRTIAALVIPGGGAIYEHMPSDVRAAFIEFHDRFARCLRAQTEHPSRKPKTTRFLNTTSPHVTQ